MQRRLPTLNEETAQDAGAAARAGRGARHQRGAARPHRHRHHAQPAAALLRPVRDGLQLLQLLLHLPRRALLRARHHRLGPARAGQHDRQAGGLARLDGRRRARQRRGRAGGDAAVRAGPAVRRRRDAQTAAPTARPASAATSSATRASSRPSTRSPATRARPACRARPSPAARACPRARPSPPSPRPASTPTCRSRSAHEPPLERSHRPDRARRGDRRRAVRLDQGGPVPAALRDQGGVRELQQHPARLAGPDRRRRGRQGHRASSARAATGRSSRCGSTTTAARSTATRRPRSGRGSSSRATSSST